MNSLMIDVESHFKSIHNKMIYHIGWVFGNAKDRKAPRKEREFFVKEFLPLNYWKHSFIDKDKKSRTFGKRLFWKMDSRGDAVHRHILAHPHKIKSWNEIIEILKLDCSMVDAVGSYNWGFDSSAIDDTNRTLNHQSIVDTLDSKKFFCLLDCYVNKVINRNYFIFIDGLDEGEIENYKSKSGKNLGYSAEIMARYMMQHHDYIESHLALEDARIEFELLEHFLSKYNNDFKTEFLGNPKYVSWTKIRDRWTATKKLEARKLLSIW